MLQSSCKTSTLEKCHDWRVLHNNTWELVPKTPLHNLVGCKWVFKVKYNSDGFISCYKARLVAKGYNQMHDYDYNETFSPVAKATTIKLLLSIVVTSDWEISQLDLSNVFLHGTLHENVCMIQPPDLRILWIHIMFVNYASLYMALNRHPERGMKLFMILLSPSVSTHPMHITQSLYNRITYPRRIYSSMPMTYCLPEAHLLNAAEFYHFCNNSSQLKILEMWAIFLVYKLHEHRMECSFHIKICIGSS